MSNRECCKTYRTSEQTKIALIHAAGRLAGQRGFNDISTREIAESAGENIGGIHYHFGGKALLFKAVIDEAIAGCLEYTAADALAPFEKELDKPEVQSLAIRAAIHRHVALMFDPQKPTWHAKVVYQVLQNKSDLQDYLSEKLIKPDLEVQKRLIKTIMPGLTESQALMHNVIMLTPIFFHANNMEYVLEMLGEKKYSEKYLEELEDALVRQTQLLFGLPLDKYTQSV